MRIDTHGAGTATVSMTTDELILVAGALNEVCNGVHELENDSEFATRLGASREDGRLLLDQVGALVRRLTRDPT